MTPEQFTFWLKGYVAAGGPLNDDIVKAELKKVVIPFAYVGSQWPTTITTTPATAPSIYPTITWTSQDYGNKNP
jgi:hypothetical protein